LAVAVSDPVAYGLHCGPTTSAPVPPRRDSEGRFVFEPAHPGGFTISAALNGPDLGMATRPGATTLTSAVIRRVDTLISSENERRKCFGDREFAAAIKAARWPPHPQAFRDIAAVDHTVADALDAAGDTSKGAWRPQFAESLVGRAGDALLATHDRNVMGENGWFDHCDGHRAAGNAANDVADYQDGLRRITAELADIAEAAMG